MVGGFVLSALALGVAEGSYRYVIEAFTRSDLGHVQVHRRGYLERPSLYETVDDMASVARALEAVGDVVSWTPRVRAPALALIGSKTTGVSVVGIDPAREARTTSIRRRIRAGTYLPSSPDDTMLVSAALSQAMGANAGAEIALIAQAADGSIANALFRVVGVIGDPRDAWDRRCYVHIRTAQTLLALGERVHEIAIVLASYRQARVAARNLGEALADAGLDASPWQVVRRDFYTAMQADLAGDRISLLIIMFLVAVGVLNTVLMSVLERTREFAVLRALGTRPFGLFRLIVLETACLATASVVVGEMIALPLNGWLAAFGLPLPVSVEFAGVRFDRLYGSVSAQSAWMPALLTLCTAVIVSVAPAFRAARMDPAQGLRAH
jgi:ABC-type lipoprotein release transport system permease subunit